jgi:hypothetical protein
MSFTITEGFVNQYSANFHTLTQQKTSKLEGLVTVESSIVGASKAVERIGAAEAYQLTSRHTDTTYVDTPHSRRWLDLSDWAWADLVDEMDKIKALIDPTSPYVSAAVAALNRRKDQVILAALEGSARTATSTAALGATNKVAHGSARLTLAKLTQAKMMLDEFSVDPDGRVYVCAPEQIYDLLQLATTTSADYSTVRALVNGEIDTYLGFKFVTSNYLTKSDATHQYSYAFHKDAIVLGIGKDVTTSIDVLPTKNQSVQVYARMSLGAVRVEENMVVQIDNVTTTH